MTPTTVSPEAGAVAPAPPSDAPVESLDELFPAKQPRRDICTLKEAGKAIVFEALSPRDYEEVNHAAVQFENGVPKLDNRLWNARLIARAMRIQGKRPWKDEQGWRALAIRIAEGWSIADVQQAAEFVADLSGISKKAREAMEAAAGNGSGGTDSPSSSIS